MGNYLEIRSDIIAFTLIRYRFFQSERPIYLSTVWMFLERYSRDTPQARMLRRVARPNLYLGFESQMSEIFPS